MNIMYKFNSGKNPKWRYYLVNLLRYISLKYFCRIRLNRELKKLFTRKDKEYIVGRVDYYNKLLPNTFLPLEAQKLAAHKFKKKRTVYFFDTYEFTRWFPQSLRWCYCFGDITEIPLVPSILKSRPIQGDNANSVLLNLDKVRHFIFLNDKIPFSKKINKIIFRGKVVDKPRRIAFMEEYFTHPMCDLGDVSKPSKLPSVWRTEKKTLWDHLRYKFILALEGNDVASNLKWVMSSNSIAVMPKPIYETWFMEGKLIANYHYIEIKEDYSDLEERLNYYIEHEDEALLIIEHAHEYVEQFKDKKRERMISLLVLQKYFEQTGQLTINKVKA
ncbi:MAG: glycosyl transferase family 90 [Bacteroidaceae bacterium]